MIDFLCFKPLRLLTSYEVESHEYRSTVDRLEDDVLYGWWRRRCINDDDVWPPEVHEARWCARTGECLTHKEPGLNLIYYGDL